MKYVVSVHHIIRFKFNTYILVAVKIIHLINIEKY